MSIDFLRVHGFTEDPFASTNAADEPLIDQYFVAPPFFPAVIGDPSRPKSTIVFAPRGGGKTAQKIMIEKAGAQSPDYLCISYDRFPTEGIPASGVASQQFHLTNISRIILIAYLLKVETDPQKFEKLDSASKKLIIDLSRELLGSISSEKYREALNSIKTFGDKAYDVWEKYGGLVRGLVNSVAERFEFGSIEGDLKAPKQSTESIRFKFDTLVAASPALGFQSIYILVDRVDELTFTANNAERAFEFLRQVLIDLPLLETPRVAFKFFLWDQTRDAYLEAGGRPDRLLEYSLDWSPEELGKVLSKRLETYSGGKVSHFGELLSDNGGFDVHKMIAHFAHSSPRDMIRICKRVVDEHTRSGVYSGKIPFRTVKSALLTFSGERARELYGTQVTELKKIADLNFTIGTVANEVFRVSHQAARSKVQKWQASGAVVKIGDVPNPGNRPQYLYGIVDPRLALAINADVSVEDALDSFFIICPHCSSLRIAYEGEITCPDCQGNFRAEAALTLGTVCRN
jgi:hypothetical protein